jgi:hypothetical protein
MMNEPIPANAEPTLFSLSRGGYVEAVDAAGIQWAGTVETTTLELGIFWIHTDCGERKLLDVCEHTIETIKQS